MAKKKSPKKTKHKKILLTDPKIRDAKPKDKRTYLRDTRVDGLRVLITPKGSKSFQFSLWVKHHGPFTYTIGKCTRIDIATARKKAKIINGEIALYGADAIEKIKGNSDGLTLNGAFDAWINYKEKHGVKDIRNFESRYRNHIKPTIGNKRVSALTPAIIKKWHTDLLSRKKAVGKGTISPTVANRCLEMVRAIYNSQLPSLLNPASKIERFTECQRERYLGGDELNRFFDALKEYPQDFQDVVTIALVTGARKGNIFAMRYDEIDIDHGVWLIPAYKSKNAKPMPIPLIGEAVKIIERRLKTAINKYVFPGPLNGHMSNIQWWWEHLLKDADITDFRFHDLRHCCGSWMAICGASDLMISKQLGHSSLQSTRGYTHIRDSNVIKAAAEAGFEAMKEAAGKNVVD